MLRNVCDGCGKIIDREPIEKEYVDALLMLDGEPILIYDDLCDTCKSSLRGNVKLLLMPTAKKAMKDKPAKISHDESEAEATETSTVVEVKSPVVEDKPEIKEDNGHKPLQEIDKELLPNQVTKQFPIKMKDSSAS